MSEHDGTILIIDEDAALADRLKALIEFMDTPSVVTAAPADWRQRLGERRLEALFVGPELGEQALSTVLSDLERLDPNVPVVVIGAGS